MPPTIFDYMLVLLFLIISGVSLNFVVNVDVKRTQRFRTIIIALYGITGIVLLLILLSDCMLKCRDIGEKRDPAKKYQNKDVRDNVQLHKFNSYYQKGRPESGVDGGKIGREQDRRSKPT